MAGFSQASARLFVVPTSLGLEHRILGGYVYLSPNSITDEATIAQRAELFTRAESTTTGTGTSSTRSGAKRSRRRSRDLEALEISELPEVEDEALVTEGRGGGQPTTAARVRPPARGLDRICHYHFELVNLGYGAYLAFYELCRQAFPDISDQAIAKMVAGIDVVALRPDDELRRLARRRSSSGSPTQVKAARGEEGARRAGRSRRGERWLADYARRRPLVQLLLRQRALPPPPLLDRRPDAPDRDDRLLRGPLETGEDISRPRDQWSPSATGSPTSTARLLPEEYRGAFDEQLVLARTVFPHIENHNFYVDHWYHTVFWNKVREFGALLAAARVSGRGGRHLLLAPRRGAFGARRAQVVLELGRRRRPSRPCALAGDRRAAQADLRGDARWAPPPALGAAPEAVTEPVTIMHWGVTTERVQEWLESSAGTAPRRCGELRVHLGSPRAPPV